MLASDAEGPLHPSRIVSGGYASRTRRNMHLLYIVTRSMYHTT